MRWSFIVIVVSGVLTACTSYVRQQPPSLQRFEFQKPEMGVPFRIVLYATNEMQANEAVADAFRRIEQINDIMSDYDPDSELSQLSGTAGQRKRVKLSDDLWCVLQRAERLANESNGAFDVTVGPVVELWRKARREKQLPDKESITQARRATGYNNLRLDSKAHTAELLVPGMKLDLGAIAKGYADDEAMKVLRAHGVTRALVSGGGDMMAGAPPPGKQGWRIELAPLDVPDAPPTNFVLIANCALATSGDLFQHIEIGGKRYSHIVDPRTGIGLTDHSLVIVIARDGITADSLSTTASVLGPQNCMPLIRRYGAVVRIARKTGETAEVVESPDFGRFLDRK